MPESRRRLHLWLGRSSCSALDPLPPTGFLPPCAVGQLGEALTSSLAGAGSRAWPPSLQVSLSKNVVPLCCHLPHRKRFARDPEPSGCTSSAPTAPLLPTKHQQNMLVQTWPSSQWKQGHKGLCLRAQKVRWLPQAISYRWGNTPVFNFCPAKALWNQQHNTNVLPLRSGAIMKHPRAPGTHSLSPRSESGLLSGGR